MAACLAFATCVALGQDASLAALRPVISREYPTVRWITGSELEAEIRGAVSSRPRLYDTRSAAEFAVSHLRGAIRVDPEHPDLGALEVDRTRRVVVYCSVGYRSANIARTLMANGFRDVRNLEGGIFAWANSGRTVVRGDREVRQVHPYDATWGRMLRAELRATEPR